MLRQKKKMVSYCRKHARQKGLVSNNTNPDLCPRCQFDKKWNEKLCKK